MFRLWKLIVILGLAFQSLTVASAQDKNIKPGDPEKPDPENTAPEFRPGSGRGLGPGMRRGMGRGMGMGRGRMRGMWEDQEVFHFLLEHHAEIRRSVRRIDNGVETLTESDKPEVAAKIKEHAESMRERLEEGRGLRFWDDLFVAIFKNYASIEMSIEKTAKGVKVRETSDDREVVLLIQAHAEVVSKFVAHGFKEAHKRHPVPSAESAAPGSSKLEFPIISRYGGVVRLPKAVEQPRAGSKVVFDTTADAKPDAVNKGLERAARLLNLYGASGLKAQDVKIAVVLHGEATKSVLSDTAYKLHLQVPQNPNLPLIRELQKAGVEVFVCGQALNYKGFLDTEVADRIPIAAAALTVLLNKQSDGYSYVPVP